MPRLLVQRLAVVKLAERLSAPLSEDWERWVHTDYAADGVGHAGDSVTKDSRDGLGCASDTFV